MSDNQAFNQILEEVKFHISEKDFDKALDLLGSTVAKYEETPLFENDEATEYYCFAEPMEELLFLHLNNPKKEVKHAGVDFLTLYYLYGSVLVELGCAEDARKALAKAKRWNPASAAAAFEYGETFKMVGDADNFFKATMEIYPYLFTKKSIARFYRNLGYYYTEKEDYYTSACCFMFSGGYENHPMIASELAYIEQVTGKRPDPNLEDLAGCFEEHGIPLSVNEEILKIAYSYGKHFFAEQNKDAVSYFWGIFAEFVPDEDVQAVLDHIAKEK